MTDDPSEAVRPRTKLQPRLVLLVAAFAWLALGPLALVPILASRDGLDAAGVLSWRYLGVTGVGFHLPAAVCAVLLFRRRSVAVVFGAVVALFMVLSLARELVSGEWDMLDTNQVFWLVAIVVGLVWVRGRGRAGRIE